MHTSIGPAPTYPSSLEEVIQLVQALYKPGHPTFIHKVQEILQQVQRSKDGWSLADALLGNSDSQVQFFGALTFTVKLNSDWEGLSESEIYALLETLVKWVVYFAAHGSTSLALRKLVTTLALFFVRFPEKWPKPTRHLVCCLCSHIIAPNAIDAVSPTKQLLQNATISQKIILLWFSATLSEEISRLDYKNIKNHKYHGLISNDVDETILLMNDAINVKSTQTAGESFDPKLVEEGLKCFGSWVNYSLAAAIQASKSVPQLKSLTPMVIKLLTNGELFDYAAEVIGDILSGYFGFFTPTDVASLADILSGPWALAKFHEVLRGEEADAHQFLKLVVSFAEATVATISRKPYDPHSQVMLQILHGLLTVPGHPVVDEDMSPRAIEFWSSFSEHLLDSLEEDDVEQWLNEGKRHVFNAIQEYWSKIKIPPVTVSRAWPAESKEGFTSYRKDVADLIETAYPLLHKELFDQFVNHTLGRLDHPDWEEIEASLFCLSALSDSLTEEPEEDESLKRLFASSLFQLLSEGQREIPLKTCQTAVNLIGSYAIFFERHPSFLPTVLNFLFTTLSTPTLARSASKSISNLCASCRDILTQELHTFLYQYGLFATAVNADDLAKERVIGAIGCVIQALPSEQDKATSIQRLLEFLQSETQKCLAFARDGKLEYAKETALVTLRCLTNVGKGLQVPDDIPILVEGEGESSERELSFWEQEQGLAIQGTIVYMIEALVQAVKEDADVVDAACSVFKTGFTESLPGPFVFPPDVTTNFLLQRAVNSTRVETIVNTATTMINSHSTKPPQCKAILELVVSLVEKCGDPQQDPDISESLIAFMTRLMSKHPEVILDYEPKDRIETTFLFILDALLAREPLVKKNACQFWAHFLSTKDDRPRIQGAINSVIQACGPTLAEKLIWGIGGGAARSDVDYLTDPLKKLIFHQPRSKMWLYALLSQPNFPSPKLTMNYKRIFLEKLMTLRGGKGTIQVTKEFWLEARGSDLYSYAS